MVTRMKTTSRSSARSKREVVRYAVIGLGHIAQAAVLPAFRHARANTIFHGGTRRAYAFAHDGAIDLLPLNRRKL